LDPATVMPYLMVGLIGGLVAALVTIFLPAWARISAPVYAAAQGLALGAISAFYEQQLHGIVFQAIGLTFGVLTVMLIAYRSGLIRVTDKFRLIVVAATGAIALLYLVSIVLSFFGTTIPFIHQGGTFGIVFSLVVVGIAAMNLALDFDFIQRGVEHGAPKPMEWYAAFGVMVTLIWLYLESLRLLSKVRRREPCARRWALCPPCRCLRHARRRDRLPELLPQRPQIALLGRVVPEDEPGQEPEDGVGDPTALGDGDATALRGRCDLVGPRAAERGTRWCVDPRDQAPWRFVRFDHQRHLEPARLLPPVLGGAGRRDALRLLHLRPPARHAPQIADHPPHGVGGLAQGDRRARHVLARHQGADDRHEQHQGGQDSKDDQDPFHDAPPHRCFTTSSRRKLSLDSKLVGCARPGHPEPVVSAEGTAMSAKDLIEGAVEHLQTSASVKTVYGAPITADGNTVIPVAKVAYGFGAGSGSGHQESRKRQATGRRRG
jgi:hypothetical protein